MSKKSEIIKNIILSMNTDPHSWCEWDDMCLNIQRDMNMTKSMLNKGKRLCLQPYRTGYNIISWKETIERDKLTYDPADSWKMKEMNEPYCVGLLNTLRLFFALRKLRKKHNNKATDELEDRLVLLSSGFEEL